MKKPTKRVLTKTETPAPAYDLTGKRYGKWVVLKYLGNDFYWTKGLKRYQYWWLCRCECGAEKTVVQSSLIYQHSAQCLHCARTKHGLSDNKLYKIWYSAKLGGRLCNEWQDFDVFRTVVGEPPDDAARLKRYVSSKPHGPGNSYWYMPTNNHLPPRLRRTHKEENVSQNSVLMKIRNAKTKDEIVQHMIAARKAGFTYEMVAVAAGVSRQWVHRIITKHLEK